MATETTVLVTCDRCGDEHYHGPAADRPKHVHMTIWEGPKPDWSPADLCEDCAADLFKYLDDFTDTRVPDERTTP